METSHRLATALMAAAVITSPARAQTRFWESAITFDDLRIVTNAIDPNGPAPGVVQTLSPSAFLHNELCFVPASCQQVYLYDDSFRPGSTPMPLHSSIAYLGSTMSGDVAPGMTSIAAHVEFTEGTRQNKGEASAEFMMRRFNVLPNTEASFSVRLHGNLGAIDPSFPYYGRLYAWSSLGGPAVPQTVELWLLPSPVAQAFDQRMTVYMRNDSDEIQQAWLDLRSGFELQLLVPEPSTWLMLLAGLGVLSVRSRLKEANATCSGSLV